MGNLARIKQDEIYKLGYECAFEDNGIDVNKFKLTNDEKKLFLEGYKAALEDKKLAASKQEQNRGMSKAA